MDKGKKNDLSEILFSLKWFFVMWDFQIKEVSEKSKWKKSFTLINRY